MGRTTLISLGFLILITLISFQSITGANKFSCEVCVLYNDKKICQKTRGEDKARVINQAIISACAGTGVDGFTEDDCQSKKPVKLKCLVDH